MRVKWLSVGCASAVILGVMGISAPAEAVKLAVVDTAKVVKEYEKTKEAQARLEKELEAKKDELKKSNEELVKMKEELERQKGIVSDKKYNKMAKKYEEKQDVFRENYREMQSVLVKKQQVMLEGILQDVKDIVKKIAKSEKYELVMEKESVLFHNGKDITYKVLDRLNK